MANENLTSIEFTTEEKTTVKTAITSVNEVLEPKLISLTTGDRVERMKMGDGSVSFVEKVLDYAQSNPEFAPPYMNVPELAIDLNAVKDLQSIYRPLVQLVKLLDDSILLSGSEAMVASLSYYASIRTASKMNIPNAKPIYDDLKKRFARSRRTSDTEV